MPSSYVLHSDIVSFADERVNLKRDDVKEYRDQVNRLRGKLEAYIRVHPDYGLVKMLHSGSVAKGTALKTINDMDVAVYVRKESAPADEGALHEWLIDRLREAYPALGSEQFTPQSHCVTVSFRGSGLDVDVVPVLYEGDPENRGYLITKDFGDRVLTSIPLHIEFIRERKNSHPHHFRQVVRLVKWWARQRKGCDSTFRFKSFMVELLCCHLVDSGVDMSDYPLALERFFSYIITTRLQDRVSFTDYYGASKLPSRSESPIEIFDPVNPDNNVARRYMSADQNRIVEAAHDALDALTEAHYANTKSRAVDLWKSVFGPSFRV